MTKAGPDARPLLDFHLREVKVSDRTDWRFLALRDDQGRCGYGEFSYDGAPGDMADRMGAFVTPLVGRPAHRRSLSGMRQSAYAAGRSQSTLFSAVEQALADLEARSADQPLWKYLGGPSGDIGIPLYANINRRTVDRSPDGFAGSAAEAIQGGFSRIKIAPFDGVSPDLPPADSAIIAGIDRIAAVRSAIGENVLMVDCHWRFNASQITRLLGELARLNVTWLECPMAETDAQLGDIVAIRKAANAAGMRLAGLETCAGWENFRPFVAAGAYDVIMPDIKHCGGYAAFMEIAERAFDMQVAVSAHNPTGPIAHLASLHATAAIGAPEALEIQFDESRCFFKLTDPPPPPVNGISSLPAGIGLGTDMVGWPAMN